MGEQKWHPQGKECQCVRCGRVFTSESALSRHETITGTCYNPATMVFKKGMREGDPVFRRIIRRERTMWQLEGDNPHAES